MKTPADQTRARRRSLPLAALVAVFAVVLWYSFRPDAQPPVQSAPKQPVPATAPPGQIAPSAEPAPATPPASTSSAEESTAFEGIERLNAPKRSIRDDLVLLSDLLSSWQTLFPRQGNPWGENTDITTALTGSNARGIALIPRNHPAINRSGELVDRWGTPFFFHQLSGTRMEIRSAGPDRVFNTADDTVLSP